MHQFVVLQLDVRCYWQGSSVCPAYRLFVNNELFTERTFIWKDHYLVENLQTQAAPGVYTVQLVTVSNASGAMLAASNLRVLSGPAKVTGHNTVQVFDA